MNMDSDAPSDASSGWGPEDDTLNVSDSVIEACHELYQTFYIEECQKIPKTCENSKSTGLAARALRQKAIQNPTSIEFLYCEI